MSIGSREPWQIELDRKIEKLNDSLSEYAQKAAANDGKIGALQASGTLSSPGPAAAPCARAGVATAAVPTVAAAPFRNVRRFMAFPLVPSC